MFSKEDYKEYFQQIAALERAMIFNMFDVMTLLDDEKIKNSLIKVANDEKRHYLYIKQVFDSILFKGDTEKREFLRNHSLGKARIKLEGSTDSFDGYCINISEGGICVESAHYLNPGNSVELWVDFFDGRQAQHYRGRLIWCAKIKNDLYIQKVRYQAGLHFETK